jgi:hypothetical protein
VLLVDDVLFFMSYDPKIHSLRVDLPTQETNPSQLVLLSFQSLTRFDMDSKLGLRPYVCFPSTKVTWQNSVSEPSWERRRYNERQFHEKFLIFERILLLEGTRNRRNSCCASIGL